MDPENPVRKSPEQIPTRGASEVEQQHEFDMLVLQGIDDVVLAGRLENTRHLSGINVFGLHPMRPANLQNAGLTQVGNHHFDLGRKQAVVNGAENHIEVGPRARAEDANAEFVARTQGRPILSKTVVVERPGTNGRIRTSAAAAARTDRSSGSSDSVV